MKKKLLIILISIFSFLFSKSVFAEELEEFNTRFKVSFNTDLYNPACGLNFSYKINDYFGIQAAIQYLQRDASKVRGEVLHTKEEFKDFLTGVSYKHFFIPLILDIYLLRNNLKTSFGIGYIDKKLIKNNNELFNKNKFVGIVSIGYEGFFSSEQGFGYDVNLGIKYLDITLESKDIKYKDSKFKIVPEINIALTYTF